MKKALCYVVYISTISMLYQAISNTELGIISQFTHQNGNTWAGPLCTSLLFLGSGFGSLYNKYLDKFSFRKVLFLGSFGYTIFIGLSIIFLAIGFTDVVLFIILLGSLISGIVVSAFYNAQFNYVN
jgi:hypothetical protein